MGGKEAMTIVEAVFEGVWNRQDFTEVNSHVANDMRLHVGGATTVVSREGLCEIVRDWHAGFPDFRFEIHSVTADRDIIAVRATLHGTHQGTWSDLEPTGRRIAVEHAFFLRIEGGLLVEVWEILDRSAFRAQLVGDRSP